jgi:hypothetical protein
VVLFRAIRTKSEALSGIPLWANLKNAHTALSFLDLGPLNLRKLALPARFLDSLVSLITRDGALGSHPSALSASAASLLLLRKFYRSQGLK